MQDIEEELNKDMEAPPNWNYENEKLNKSNKNLN
jgi:hypothetical protein